MARDGRMSCIRAFICPKLMYEALLETAFKERCKIHDLVMEGIGLALRKRGYPPIDALKAGRQR